MPQLAFSFDIAEALPHVNQAYGMVPLRSQQLVFEGQLRPMEGVFYGWLCARANGQGELYWSIAAMSHELGVVERTVVKYIADLIGVGLIRRVRRLGRSTITRVVGHPKVTNQMKRGSGSDSEDGKPRNHHSEDPGDPVEQDPIRQTNPNQTPPPTPPPSVTSPEPPPIPAKTADDDDDDDGFGLRLQEFWKVAEEAGYPTFRAFEEPFLAQIARLKRLLDLPDQAILAAFEAIDKGQERYYPQTGGYWLQRLLTEAAKYRPTREPEPEKTEKCRPGGRALPDEEQKNGPSWLETPDWWPEILERIREKVPDATYSRWFSGLRAGELGDTLFLWSEDEFDASFTETNFRGLIELYLDEHLDQTKVLQFVSGTEPPDLDLVFKPQDDLVIEVGPLVPISVSD